MPNPDGTPKDNEDIVHKTAMRDARMSEVEYNILKYTPNVEVFTCGLCQGDMFVMLASKDETGLVQLVCAKSRCPGRTKVLELRKPQMSDNVAKRLGLWVPSNVPLIDETFDLDDDVLAN